ncbi:MAG TPA: glycosyltransferase [Solirubrobacteraceae bacterium]|nr:glycosyltransferase [Solirubrobacteraceae bacterium]
MSALSASSARVSIVVDNFEYERFLGEAIDSALAQTHDDVEVLVVDDGSRDGSRDVIASYGQQVTAVLKDNGGQASAFNAGFAASSGEVVIFLDSDDVLEPGAAAAAVDELRRAPYAKLHWPLREVDRDGRPLGTLNPGAPLPEGELRDRVLERGPGAYATPPTSGNAFSRSFLERVMPLPEELRLCADAYLYDLAPLFGRIACVHEPLGRLRRHTSAFGGLGLEDRLEHTLLVQQRARAALRARCRELGLEPDEDGWRAHSWPLRQRRALDALWTVVPRGVPFALADAGTFMMEPPAVPLAPDASAHEVGEAGIRFLVVPWPGFAWLASVRPALGACRVLLETDDLVVLELP